MVIQKEYARCLRCGRRLKNLEARRKGYGDICFNKQLQKKSVKLFQTGQTEGKTNE